MPFFSNLFLINFCLKLSIFTVLQVFTPYQFTQTTSVLIDIYIKIMNLVTVQDILVRDQTISNTKILIPVYFENLVLAKFLPHENKFLYQIDVSRIPGQLIVVE